MKEKRRAKGYMRYSDDAVGFGRTKGEARRQMRDFILLAECEIGLVVKANVQLAPLARFTGNGKGKRHRRKRQRGKGRKDA